MNKGMMMMLKALGLEIAPEHLAMLQALIPQLPAKINEVVQGINAALANFDARLRALEIAVKAISEVYNVSTEGHMVRLAAIEEVLKNGNTSGVSDTARPASGRRSGRASAGNGGTGISGSGDDRGPGNAS